MTAPPVADALVALRHTTVHERAVSLRHVAKTAALRTRFDLTPRTTDNVNLRASTRVAPDCAHCTDKCCARAENKTVLRLIDIARLLDAGLGEHIAPGGPGERAAQIKKRADGACVFLDDDGACSIYALRPLVCRRFPYRVDEARTSVVWSSGCAVERSAPEEESETLLNAALESYNEMLFDILALTFAGEELEALGLRAFLHEDTGL